MIDVLIASYNCEDTVESCIDSIPAEILGFGVRIVVVDDCSTDLTFENLKTISRIDVLLRNESNLGVGETRKRLLKTARSEYVLFLDADDYMEKNRPGLKGRPRELSEVVVLQRNIPTRKKATHLLNRLFISYGELTAQKTDELLNELTRNKTTLPECWGYIFSRAFLVSNEIDFPGSRVCEDIVFMTQALSKCNSFMFSHELLVVKSTSVGISRGIGEEYILGAGVALMRIISMKMGERRGIVSAYQDLVIEQLTREFATYTLWPKEKSFEVEKFINDCLAFSRENKKALQTYEMTVTSTRRMIRDGELMFRSGYEIYVWFVSPLSITICEYLAQLDCTVMMIVDDVRNGFTVTDHEIAACSFEDHKLDLRRLQNACVLIPTFNMSLNKSIEERYRKEACNISFIRLDK